MGAWWDSLSGLQTIFASIAIPASIIMVLQTVMLMIGIGQDSADGDFGDSDFPDGDEGGAYDGHTHAEPHDSGLRVLTIRGLVAFFAIGGWAGVALPDLGADIGFTIFGAFIAGMLSLMFVAYSFKLAMRLQENGNINLNNAIGEIAQVYITIPPALTGKGKVTITLQERFVEISAMTELDTPIKPGMLVEVVSTVDQDTLLVTPSKIFNKK